MMETYFASAEKSDAGQLQQELKSISNNAFINQLMVVVDGLVAVLNANRQILVVNDTLLNTLGLGWQQSVLGLRPGEAIGCNYAHLMEGGCGTSEFCPSCGVAISIVTCQSTRKPIKRVCSIAATRNGQPRDLYFMVHARPFDFGDHNFILLFLQDISRQQELSILERVFFHDINNSLMGLITAGDLLAQSANQEDPATNRMAKFIRHFGVRLTQDVAMLRNINKSGIEDYRALKDWIEIKSIVNEVKQVMSQHPSSEGKQLEIENHAGKQLLFSDINIVQRILCNMIINAFEATPQGQSIRFMADVRTDKVVFQVWNKSAIDKHIGNRIFQRNFSTKGEFGRGLGTYSMKLFGEHVLGGKVYFTSRDEEGTTFYFVLPLKPAGK